VIEVVVDDRCTRCDVCVLVCPTNVFDAAAGQAPVIARQEDCQTCFLCELYCPTDALYVAPDCEQPVNVSVEEVVASGWLGQFRRDSGWGEWRKQPEYRNQSWLMDRIFARARAMENTPQHSG
jgi:NAD-dependent dihydropyrimidine dehydrogenase PreA subunit